MGFKLLYAAWLALAASVSANNLHRSTEGPLQIPSSFTGDGITMYPGLRSGHDTEDLDHLKPHNSRELYYSQEGHRPAVHGAKHGSLQATFIRPTIVLDHSSQLRDIKCSDRHIEICFKTHRAFETVHESWHVDDGFNLVTYHMRCGDQTSGKRSFFHAKQPVFDTNSNCVRVATIPIEEHEALESGRVAWGTYMDPDNRKRDPVKGHVRVVQSNPSYPPVYGNYGNHTGHGNHTRINYVDLNRNATAVKDFFDNPNIDTSHMEQPVPAAVEPEFISTNGTVMRRDVMKRSFGHDVARFFRGLWNGILSFFESIGNFFKSSAGTVAKIANLVLQVAIVAAKLIAVPFGVPFKHSYHEDFKFHKYLTGEASNRPPKIFGIGDGFNLASSGNIYSVQCAKCGIHADITVDGEFAFNIRDGITEGTVSLRNQDQFRIDAQFGITIEDQDDQSIKRATKQLAAIPLSPLAIPGIITLGPQASISVALDLVLNGKAEMLLGGSLSIQPGVAALSLVHKKDNKLEGLQVKFTPVAKVSGALTATIELGLPIALEAGLDVLNGKFKKTVGLVNKPSVYASATHSIDEGHKCDKGIELRAGVKNRVYVAALGLWDYDIRTDILYEKGIGCVTPNGFNPSAVEPDQSVFKKVTDKLNADVGTQAVQLTDLASRVREPHTKTGYRVIMDYDQTSILVSGQDGYIYLVKSEQKYDLSAPWGTINVQSNAVDLDVFGRIMSNYVVERYVATVYVNNVDKVPQNHKAAALSILKTEEKDYHSYGVIMTVDQFKLTSDNGLVLWYPTFCPTSRGLRLYATALPIDKKGYVVAPVMQANEVSQEFAHLGIPDRRKCRTVRLTSEIKGA